MWQLLAVSPWSSYRLGYAIRTREEAQRLADKLNAYGYYHYRVVPLATYGEEASCA